MHQNLEDLRAQTVVLVDLVRKAIARINEQAAMSVDGFASNGTFGDHRAGVVAWDGTYRAGRGGRAATISAEIAEMSNSLKISSDELTEALKGTVTVTAAREELERIAAPFATPVEAFGPVGPPQSYGPLDPPGNFGPVGPPQSMGPVGRTTGTPAPAYTAAELAKAKVDARNAVTPEETTDAAAVRRARNLK